jgi:hypothetical protein
MTAWLDSFMLVTMVQFVIAVMFLDHLSNTWVKYNWELTLNFLMKLKKNVTDTDKVLQQAYDSRISCTTQDFVRIK